MGTAGPVGFEPGMFKKETDESKTKGETTNKVKKEITVFFYNFLYLLVSKYI
jgi:hypothetical protein